MVKEEINQDVTYKFIIKTLKMLFFHFLGYEGEDLVFLNTERIPVGPDQKIMDILVVIDGKVIRNIEFQSTPVYEPKMVDMYKYRIYYQAEEYCEFKTTVFATYPPTQGIEEIELDGDIKFRPDFFYTKNLKATEIIKTIKTKNENQEPLTNDEAISLILTPDTSHNYDIEELLKTSSELLANAIIPNPEFRSKIVKCQRKMLQRFLNKEKREEIEKMYKFRAEDYGIEPNVTGIEEEIILSYQDGRREGFVDGRQEGFVDGRQEGFVDGRREGFVDGRQKGVDDNRMDVAKRLIESDCDDEFIVKISGLELDVIKKLREKLDD